MNFITYPSLQEQKHLESSADFSASPGLNPHPEGPGVCNPLNDRVSSQNVRDVVVVQSAVSGAQPAITSSSSHTVVQGPAEPAAQGISPTVSDAEGGTAGVDASAVPDATAAPDASTASVQQPDLKRVLAPQLAEANRPQRKRSKNLQAGAEGDTSCGFDKTDKAQADSPLEDFQLPPSGQIGNQHRDVVLRIEFISPLELKILSLLMVCSLLAGIAVTIYFKVKAQYAGTSWYLLNSSAPNFRDNYIAGTVCIAIPLGILLVYLLRGVWFVMKRRCWDQRRFRIYLSRVAELTVTIISMAAWTYAGSERRLESDCQKFRKALLWTYAVRLTAANTLLCIWTMSARAMTVHTGGPIFQKHKQALGTVRQSLAQWWGCCRICPRKGLSSSLDHNEAAGVPGGPVSIALTATATSRAEIARSGSRATDYGTNDEAGPATAEVVVRGLAVEDGAASERLAAAVVVLQPQTKAPYGLAARGPSAESPVATAAAVEVAPPLLCAAASRAASGAGGGHSALSDVEVEVEAELPLREPHAVSVAEVSESAVSSCTSSPGRITGACPPAPQPEQHQQTGPGASQSPLLSVEQGASEQTTPPLPRPGPAAACLARESMELLGQISVPTWGADSAIGAAALVAAAATAAVEKAHQEPDGESRMVASRAAKCAAEQMMANMGRDEQLHIDSHWREYLAPVAWLWAPFQCIVAVNISITTKGTLSREVDVGCTEVLLQCKSRGTDSLISLVILLIAEIAYVIIYFGFCLKAFLHLRSRSYVLYRQLNIYLSVEVRIRGLAILFLVVNDFVQALIVPATTNSGGVATRCRFSLDSILGLWSTQVVTMVVVSLVSWIFIPRSVQEDLPIMQATLQRFAWTERDLPRQRKLRLTTVPRNYSRIAQLEREPMFCFETAVKLTYWCEHAYYYEEPGCEMRLPLQKLMDLFDLENILVIRNEESDAKVMIAWSLKHCLLCFRGTASLKAACVDLKIMLVPYYQRSFWMHKHKVAALAAVHHGFQWSWIHGGFHQQVLDWVRSYREQHPHGKIMVTGHSLGGAHALLCAMDIVRELGESLPYDHLMCYTYGAPRVGDHAFAGLYNRVVAETWHVINGNDMVPLAPKYVGWFVYKQPGHKVVVKRRGDIIVRPTFTENALIRLPGSRSVRHHLLGSYLRSLMSVLRSQTRGKHIEGGVRGLLHLSRYQLPEVEAVLEDLVQQVREMAAAAVTAVASSSGRLGGLSSGSGDVGSEQTSAAMALAAGSAARGGEMIFHFMARNNSFKLLFDHQSIEKTPAAIATRDAHAPPDTAVHQQRPLPRDHHARHLLLGLLRRIDLGMQLFGVETGITAEEDEGDYSPNGYRGSEDGGGRDHRGGRAAISDGTKAAQAAERAAFEHAAASRAAAQMRYRRMKRCRAREHNSADRQGRRLPWMSNLAPTAAAGFHNVTAGSGVSQQHQRAGAPRGGSAVEHMRDSAAGLQLRSASANVPLGYSSTGNDGPSGGCDSGDAGSKADGGGSMCGEASNSRRKKIRAARLRDRTRWGVGGSRGLPDAVAADAVAADADAEEEGLDEDEEEKGEDAITRANTD
ncbi:hypothetical protein Vafri_16558 [Volvox africanus]|uniref:Fungal lipase-type domain-containing protein n=1 Tax=Volvox africanus TaxID=51714 RepID=A0A8J4BHH9_9CHLO|nr:hypothetical protein Vafri_16558 [Volvox africanus]